MTSAKSIIDPSIVNAHTTGAGHLSEALRSGEISIRNAGKVYDSKRSAVVALDQCSAEIRAGEFVAIVGPSGCGKSTLLNALAGFDQLSSGTILLDGVPIAGPGLVARPGPDRVVVFQQGALFPWMTVLENVVYGPTRQRRLAPDQARSEALAMLRRCGNLESTAERYPGTLSSGMQRRVEIVRALMNAPKVLLLDEPFRAMDTVSKSAMHRHLLDMHSLYPKTVLFITHDLDEAIFLADTVYVMTTRPGRMKNVLRVNLPRPRTPEMLASQEYLELKRQASAGIHEEALKAFERGERELA
jgi:NitT/TauT family transport system ATP-binding protein